MSHTGTSRSRQHDVSTMVWGNLPRTFARLPVLCLVFSDKERDNLTQCDVRRRCHQWRTALRPSILNQVGWFWAVPIRIANRQQKHKPLPGMFCRLHFVRTIFFENRIRNRLYQCCFVLWYWGIVTVSLRTSQGSMHKRLRIVDVLPHPVTFECMTICDQNVTKCVLLEKLKKIQSMWPMSQFRNCDILWPSKMSQMVTHWEWLVQTLFLALFEIRIGTTLISPTKMVAWKCFVPVRSSEGMETNQDCTILEYKK
jgi:hypothetical protein